MDWADYSKILMEKSRMAGIPSAATFELTPFCNFNCNMCYIRLSPKQAKKQGKLLTTDQWLQIADETKRLGVIGIELTGGEAVTRYSVDNGFIHSHDTMRIKTHGGKYHGKKKQT